MKLPTATYFSLTGSISEIFLSVYIAIYIPESNNVLSVKP